MKKVFIVTGATGFVGNNVVKLLEQRGDTIVALARDPKKADKALKDTTAQIIYGDVTNAEDIEKLFDAAHAAHKESQITLIHVASVVYLGGNKKRLQEMTNINLTGAKNAVEACLKHNCRLLYVSSVHAITETPKRGLIVEIDNFEPKDVVGKYAKTKAAASRIVMDAIKNRGLDAVLVHPAGITGPGDYSDTHLTQMVEDYKNGRIPMATNGGYDFVDVRDVAQGILLACEKGKAGDCYLLSNKYYSVKEMLNTLHELGAGKKIKMKVPRWVAVASLPFMAPYFKITKKRPLYSRYSLYTLGSNSNFSNEKAKTELGFAPRELKESLRDTVEFLK